MPELRSEASTARLAGQFIRDEVADLARQTLERQFEADPGLRGYLAGDGYRKCVEDTSYHAQALAQALLVDEPTLFAGYVIWAEIVLSNLGLPQACFTGSLAAIRETVVAALPEALSSVAAEYVDAALDTLSDVLTEPPGDSPEGAPLAGVATRYLEALLSGDRGAAAEIVRGAVAAGAILPDVYEHVFRASQQEVGRMWQSNRLSVAMEHYATGATEAIMSQQFAIEPHGAAGTRRFLGACVEGEQHDMAIRMVCDVLQSRGWDTFFLGANTPAATLVQAVEEFRPSVVGLSATWLFNVDRVMCAVRDIRDAYPEVRVVVGGAPFDRIAGLAEKVGADARGGSLLELPAQLERMIRLS